MHLYSDLLIAGKNPLPVDTLDVICTIINKQYIDHFLRCTQRVGLSSNVDKIAPFHLVPQVILHAVNICLQSRSTNQQS